MTSLTLELVVKAIDNASAVFRHVGEGAVGAARQAGSAFERIQKTSERLSSGLAGIGIGVGAAFELKDLAASSDRFERMRILSGKSAEEIERFKGALFDTSATAGIATDSLNDVWDAFRGRGGAVEDFEKTMKGAASYVQLLNGDAPQIGDALGAMFKNLQVPADRLTDGLAQIYAQFKALGRGNAGFEAVAPQLGFLLTEYEKATNRSGSAALSDVGSVASLVYAGSKNKREAVTQTAAIFDMIGAPDTGVKLWNIGHIQRYASEADKRAGRTRPVVDIIKDIAKVYNSGPYGRYRVNTGFGADLVDPLRLMFSELKDARNKGRSPTLDKVMAAQGNYAADDTKARQLAESFGGAAASVKDRIDQMGESAANMMTPVSKLIAANKDLAATAAVSAGALLGVGSAINIAKWAVVPVITGTAAAVAGFGGILARLSFSGALASARALPALSEGLLGLSVALEAMPIATLLAIPAALAAIGGAAKVYWDAAMTDPNKPLAMMSDVPVDSVNAIMPTTEGYPGKTADQIPDGLYDWIKDLFKGTGPQASAQPQKHDFTLRIEGLPAGAKVTGTKSGNPDDDLHVLGYGMATPQ